MRNRGTLTVFTLYLPIVQRDPDQLSVTRLAGEQRLATRRVLLVEDNENVGQFARSVRGIRSDRDLGPKRRGCSAVAGTASGKFDLVFNDVIMPGINGLELARQINERWLGLRVVLTSSYSHVLAEESDHPFEVLCKPYSVKVIMGVLG